MLHYPNPFLLSRYYYILFAVLFFSGNVLFAQNFYPVTHLSGTRVIGNTDVEVKGINNPGGYPGSSYCDAGPYWIGQGTSGTTATFSGYSFIFSKAVRMLKLQFTASDTGERISLYINGNHYNIQPADIGNFFSSCGYNGRTLITNGDLTFRAGSGIVGNNTQVVIEDSIKQIDVLNTEDMGGTFFNFYFVTDTVVEIDDCNDTLLCRGDTLRVKYSVSGTFSNTNVFSLQLSDKYGDFKSPTVLSTINSAVAGMFECVVPAIPSGEGYRLRIVASDPVYTSRLSPFTLSIGNPPVIGASNNGPVCEGEKGQITMTIYMSNYTDVFWNGPGLLPDYPTRVYNFPAVKFSDSGWYVGRVEDYGCVAYDSTKLEVRANPIKGLTITDTSVCSNETLVLTSDVAVPGSTNVWLRPDGSYDTTNTLTVVPNAAASGMYQLITYLDGCYSRDTAHISIKPVPDPQITSNTPCVGDTLRIGSNDTTHNATYIWVGPSGFVMTTKDTVIAPALLDASGKYVLTVFANGCKAVDSAAVMVKSRPYTPAANGDTVLCEGAVLHLMGSNALPDSNTFYHWTGPNGFRADEINTQKQGVSVHDAGAYVFMGEREGCTAADTLYVAVNHTPYTPQATSNSPLTLGHTLQLTLAEPEAGVAYSWTGPNGFTSNVFSPEIENVTKQHAGTYTVTGTLGNCASSAIVLITIDEIADTGYLLLYPNPNNGNFTIKGRFHAEQYVSMRITNAAGQLIYSDRVKTENKKLYKEVKLGDRLASGTYTLRVLIDGKYHSLRFAVVRQ